MGLGRDRARQKAENGRLSLRVPFVVNKDKGEAIDVHFEAWQPGARQIAFATIWSRHKTCLSPC